MTTDRAHASVTLRPYSDSDWEPVRSFILSRWGPAHPMADRRLFDWQFRGFGPARTEIRPILLFLDGRVAGFRGLIPGLYQVPFPDGMRLLPGASLAMWMLLPELRGLGLGRAMHAEAERLCPVLAGAGSNPRTSVPIYLDNGFQLLEAMNRFTAALDPASCRKRFGERASLLPALPPEGTGEALGPSAADPAFLASAWKGSAYRARLFSLFRDEEFWRWRILETPGFRYHVFVDPDGSGFLTARTERFVDPPGDGGVLRLIDLVPANPSAWNGAEAPGFSRFLGRGLAWAREAGCIAADYHCSGGMFRNLLRSAGFVLEEQGPGAGPSPVPRVFNGGRGDERPINALARAPVPVSFERSCMVKSDNDMDRPRRLDDNGQVVY